MLTLLEQPNSCCLSNIEISGFQRRFSGISNQVYEISNQAYEISRQLQTPRVAHSSTGKAGPQRLSFIKCVGLRYCRASERLDSQRWYSRCYRHWRSGLLRSTRPPRSSTCALLATLCHLPLRLPLHFLQLLLIVRVLGRLVHSVLRHNPPAVLRAVSSFLPFQSVSNLL